jgi:glyoxylase-like metal-dependent hydrolase (beta-lactamase superfamily II)
MPSVKTLPVRTVNVQAPLLIERGWLSANTVLLQDACGSTAVDTGYGSHAAQTVQLIGAALAGRHLDRIINTHLHSDHCGGNAALVAHYGCEVLIPPGEATAVATWDTQALSYDATGQACPRFAHTGLVQSGDLLHLGGDAWQVLAAPGHDPSSVVLYSAAQQTLISADALWENGFGVVFPELDGIDAFDAVAATLDMVATLNVRTILPGHGAAFHDMASAVARARTRLNGFVQDPVKHRWHAVKVLCMFWLMAQVSQATAPAETTTLAHLAQTRYIVQVAAQLGGSAVQVVQQALDEMVAKRQLLRDNGCLRVV